MFQKIYTHINPHIRPSKAYIKIGAWSSFDTSGKLIQFFQNHYPYTHAFTISKIIKLDHQVLKLTQIEVSPHPFPTGSIKLSNKTYFTSENNHLRDVIICYVPVNTYQKRKYQAIIQSQLNKKYNFKDLLEFIKKKISNVISFNSISLPQINKESWFCSELIAFGLYMSHIKIIPKIEYKKIDVRTLMRHIITHSFKTIVYRNTNFKE